MNRAAKLALWSLLAAAIAGLLLWQPWAPRIAAVRPDTGEAAARLDDSELLPVLTELLTRVYGAFGEEEEFAIYDGLAKAVASDLLTDLYLQRRVAQEQSFEDGGKTTIRKLEITELTPVPATGTDRPVDTSWTVYGTVAHGEHRHERINAYTARLTLGVAEGEWRLTGFDLDTIKREEQEPLFLDDFE